ncbi:MAG TPA: septal ring lytic transglycosylase RlpA family protein [Novosphingobium sp.]|nr:septal ring lytic transglycosylase RlpA family protein [Novosphingobium sp.]
MSLRNVMRLASGMAVPAAALMLAASAETPAFAETPVEMARFNDSFDTDSFDNDSFDNDSFDRAFSEPAAEEDAREIGTGTASFYGAAFAGKPTASGERFDPAGLTAAHRSLPFGSKVRVTNRTNGQSVVVRINDRGPFHGNRLIDLSHEAARRIGIVSRGSGSVELALLAS